MSPSGTPPATDSFPVQICPENSVCPPSSVHARTVITRATEAGLHLAQGRPAAAGARVPVQPRALRQPRRSARGLRQFYERVGTIPQPNDMFIPTSMGEVDAAPLSSVMSIWVCFGAGVTCILSGPGYFQCLGVSCLAAVLTNFLQELDGFYEDCIAMADGDDGLGASASNGTATMCQALGSATV